MVYVLLAVLVLLCVGLVAYWDWLDNNLGARRDRETRRRLARNAKHLRAVTPNLRVVRGGKS